MCPNYLGLVTALKSKRCGGNQDSAAHSDPMIFKRRGKLGPLEYSLPRDKCIRLSASPLNPFFSRLALLNLRSKTEHGLL